MVAYDGYTLKLSSGSKIHHEIKRGSEGDWVVLEIESPFGDGIGASLSPDDAIKLATTLLRDVSVLKFGSG